MPDYKQTNLTGEAWNRFSQINVSNPLDGQAHITCTEDQVLVIDGQQILRRAVATVSFAFDPAETFDLLNPATGEVIKAGGGSGLDVHTLVYSYVMHEAAKRDAALAAAAAPAPAPAPAPAEAPAPAPAPAPSPSFPP